MLTFSNNLIFVSAIALGMVVSGGCNRGDGIARCVVSGTVNFDGAPLPNGEIRFRAESGPLSGSPIKDGRYKVDHNGGVPIGKHTVTVTAYRMLNTANNSEGMEIDSGGDEQFIPEKYNKKSTLSVDVTGEKKRQEIDFDLEI